MAEKAKVIPIESIHQGHIKDIMEQALEEHAEFRGVLVIALINDNYGCQHIRAYYSGLSRLERKGLLDEARDVVE